MTKRINEVIFDRKIIADNINYLLEREDKRPADLARDLDIPGPTVYNWTRGDKAPSVDSLEAMARYFHVPVSFFLDKYATYSDAEKSALNNNIIPLRMKRVPILGEIACGQPIYAERQYGNFAEVEGNVHADFALTCKGDSMKDARINDGDMVFIREQPTVENGEIAAVLIDDEVTLKRFYSNDNSIVLAAANPEYAPIIISANDGKQVRVLGKAVAFQSAIR